MVRVANLSTLPNGIISPNYRRADVTTVLITRHRDHTGERARQSTIALPAYLPSAPALSLSRRVP